MRRNRRPWRALPRVDLLPQYLGHASSHRAFVGRDAHVAPPLGNGVETMFPTAARSRLANIAMPAHLGSLGYATSVSSEYAGEFFGRVLLGFEGEAVPRVELEQMLGQGFLARQPAALALAGELYSTSASFRKILPAPLPELMRGLVSFSHPYVVGADFLERRDPTRPWFAVLFYSQPHFPYTSSRGYYDLQGVSGADPSLRFGKDATRGEVKTDADRAQVDALYRSALAETDDAVGDLLSRLESSGDLEDTIVILTADHGEGLYECPDCIGHGDNLRGMMTLRVPLAIRLPKRRFPAAAPQTIVTYVSQLDVYPTVLGLLDVPDRRSKRVWLCFDRTELPRRCRKAVSFSRRLASGCGQPARSRSIGSRIRRSPHWPRSKTAAWSSRSDTCR